MKLIPIDYQNLPKKKVLAYNGVDEPQIGILLRDDETTVLCATDKGEMTNVTHYLPLDQIKPESDKIQTYFMFASLRYCGGALNTGLATRACNVTRLNNESLDGVIDEWLIERRKDVAKINNLDYKDVIVTSFSCTETT